MFNRYFTKDGESLMDVAKRFDLDPSLLEKTNNLYYTGELRENTEIVLPENNKAYFNYYIIEKGDTIYGIARKYNINPELLSQMNGLGAEDYIYPGQEILIPKNNYSYYLTAEGDTLDMVANVFKKSKANVLAENETIYLLPDQLLVSKKNNK